MSRDRLAALTVLLLGGTVARADLFPCRCQQNERPCCPPYNHPTYGYYPTQWRAWPAGVPVVNATTNWQTAPPPRVETSTFAPPPRVDIPPVYTPIAGAPVYQATPTAAPAAQPALLNLGAAPAPPRTNVNLAPSPARTNLSLAPAPAVMNLGTAPAPAANSDIPVLNLR